MSYWVDWLRYYFWGSGVGMIVVLMLLVAAVIAFFFQWGVEQREREGTPVMATITRLGFSGTKYQPGPLAGIAARDETGATGSEAVPPPFVAGCKVGDKIRAKRVGRELILQPAPCRSERPS